MLAALCVVVLSFMALSSGGALKDVDVELIPEEQRTVGADVGKSLSLGLGNSERKRRDFIDELEDQKASASQFYAPVIGDYRQLDSDELQQKEGESYRLKDVGDSRGEVGFYGASGRKGSRAQVSEDGYARDHQAARGDRLNSGYYDDDSGARRVYDVGRDAYGNQAFNRQGQAAAAFGAKGGHRKGHHSSGFKNSYHKDETGNNSRFYDDGSDEGGHYLYDARDGAFRDRGADSYHGGYEDGAYQGAARGKHGKYGAAVGYDDNRGYKGRYAHDDYSGDNTGYGRQREGESFGKNLHGGRNQEADSLYHRADEGYGSRPYYAIQHPTVIAGYVSPSGIYSKPDYYNPKAYHAEASYPAPYSNFHKGKLGESGSVIDSIPDGGIKGKGYAEYVDTGVGNYYSGEKDVIGKYDEPSYYSSIN